MDKQKGPDSSISGGDDDSEAFPTSDDHQLVSYSASASDQGPDTVDNSNRFEAFDEDDEHGKDAASTSRDPPTPDTPL